MSATRSLHSTSFGLHSSHQQAPYDRFLDTCGLTPGVQEPGREQIWTQLQERYTEGSRFYHNLDHIMAMLEFVSFSVRAGIVLQDPAAVEWAVWMHDLVYTPCSSTNEAQSAEVAGQLLSAAGLPPATVQKVQRYIVATSDHHHVDADGDVVVDAGLSILGAPLQRYVDYAVAVRKECAHLTDEQYTQQRARFLKGLLDREQLFLTDIGKSACEAAARANMSHEWRLAYGGQLLLINAFDERDETVEEGQELPSRSASLASAGTGGTDPAAAGGSGAAAAAAVAAAASSQHSSGGGADAGAAS